MNKFIAENDTGPEAPWVILCGPSAIGKSYFIKAHNFFCARKNLDKAGYKSELFVVWPKTSGVKDPRIFNVLGHNHVTLTSQPKDWPNEWYTEEYKIKQRAIILGVPFFVWEERVQKRRTRKINRGGTKRDKSFWGASIDEYKALYRRLVRILNKNDVPYIFVDNRNDFPILDESSFFTMLTSNE